MAYATSTNDAQEIKRIDLTALRKQRFIVDLGDSSEHILELNTTDIGVVSRLSEGYARLTNLDANIQDLRSDNSNITKDDNNETAQTKLFTFGEKLRTIDTEMKAILDFIFDSNVSEVCCPSGSMYDPIGGQLRYEYIIDALMQLYTESLATEMDKTKKRIKSHTAKYVGK